MTGLVHALTEVMKNKISVCIGTAQKDTPSVLIIFSVFLGEHGVLGIQEMHFATKHHGDSTGSSLVPCNASVVGQTLKKPAFKSKVFVQIDGQNYKFDQPIKKS